MQHTRVINSIQDVRIADILIFPFTLTLTVHHTILKGISQGSLSHCLLHV